MAEHVEGAPARYDIAAAARTTNTITWATASSALDPVAYASTYLQLHTTSTTPTITGGWTYNWTNAGTITALSTWSNSPTSRSFGDWVVREVPAELREPPAVVAAARAERDLRSAERAAERQAARAAARDRAEGLLLSLCSDDQRRSYQQHGYIDGITNLGRPYRIHCRRGISGNVEVLRNGEWLTLCAHPPADLPHADVLLGQKLALETDERHFMSRANIHRVRAA